MTYAASFVIETLLAEKMRIDGIFHVTIDEDENSGYTFRKMRWATPKELEPKLYPNEAKVLELPRRLGQRLKLVNGELKEIEIDVGVEGRHEALPVTLPQEFGNW